MAKPVAMSKLVASGADLREGPTCGRASRLVGQREDGYLAEVVATAWSLAAS
jgi:hypothetical protein